MDKLWVGKTKDDVREISGLVIGDKIESIEKIYLYVTIGFYIEKYSSKKSKATHSNEKTYLSNLYEYLCTKGIDYAYQVTGEHLEEFKVDLRKRVLAATVLRQFNTIKNFFNIMLKKRYIIINPCVSLEFEKSKKPKIVLWSKTDYIKIQRKLDVPTRHILRFMWLTGARNIEAVDLVWTDIDHSIGQMTLRSQKGADSFRYLAIIDSVSKLFHRVKFKGIYVFGAGSKFTSDSLGKKVKKAVIAAGCNPKLTPYGIRHTYCKDLLQANPPLERHTIQELMGHADWRTTENYAHWDIKFLKKAASSIR